MVSCTLMLVHPSGSRVGRCRHPCAGTRLGQPARRRLHRLGRCRHSIDELVNQVCRLPNSQLSPAWSIVCARNQGHAVLVGQPEPDVPAEVRGSFMWSPKQNANGARNQFYENMREVSPGDVVFSFCDTRIKAIGVVTGRRADRPEARLRCGWFELVATKAGSCPSTTAPSKTRSGRRTTSRSCVPSCHRQILAPSRER